MAAANKLDFNISRSAMALKSGQTYRVALLMSEGITSWFNAEVFAGIDDVMHGKGYDISLYQHINAPRRATGSSPCCLCFATWTPCSWHRSR